MQLLFEHSAEGDVDGLGLVPGNIVPIQTSYPVPHLGWNQLHSQHPLLQTDVYFVHSYQAEMSSMLWRMLIMVHKFQALSNIVITLGFNFTLRKR